VEGWGWYQEKRDGDPSPARMQEKKVYGNRNFSQQEGERGLQKMKKKAKKYLKGDRSRVRAQGTRKNKNIWALGRELKHKKMNLRGGGKGKNHDE